MNQLLPSPQHLIMLAVLQPQQQSLFLPRSLPSLAIAPLPLKQYPTLDSLHSLHLYLNPPFTPISNRESLSHRCSNSIEEFKDELGRANRAHNRERSIYLILTSVLWNCNFSSLWTQRLLFTTLTMTCLCFWRICPAGPSVMCGRVWWWGLCCTATCPIYNVPSLN